MYGTDMVAWVANGASSYQEDMYSTGQVTPTNQSQNAYTTTFVDDTSTTNSVIFTTTRSMQPTDNDTYSIPLDTEFSMIYAYYAGSSVVFHHNNHFQVNLTLLSNGTCVIGAFVLDNGGLKKDTLHGVLMWFSWSIISLV